MKDLQYVYSTSAAVENNGACWKHNQMLSHLQTTVTFKTEFWKTFQIV